MFHRLHELYSARPYLVNMDTVKYLYERPDNGTILIFTSGGTLEVSESLEDLLEGDFGV